MKINLKNGIDKLLFGMLQKDVTALYGKPTKSYKDEDENYVLAETVEEEEVLRLEHKEIEMIKRSLEKNKGKRKAAADELGISERTLYRKIKELNLN